LKLGTKNPSNKPRLIKSIWFDSQNRSKHILNYQS